MVILRNCEPRGFGKMCGMWIVLPLPISVAFGEGGWSRSFLQHTRKSSREHRDGLCRVEVPFRVPLSHPTGCVHVHAARRCFCEETFLPALTWCLCYPVQFPHRSHWRAKIERPLCFLWSPSVTAQAQKLFRGCCAIIFVFFHST